MLPINSLMRCAYLYCWRLFAVAGLFLLIAPVGASSDPGQAAARTNSVSRITQEYRAQVESVIILHTPTHVNYFEEFSARKLDEEAPFKLAISKPGLRERGRELMDKIDALQPVPVKAEPAIRWGFIFLDSKGNRLLSIYIDASGQRGVVNNESVEFKDNLLFQWAEDKLGQALR